MTFAVCKFIPPNVHTYNVKFVCMYIISLRNPHNKPGSITIDIVKAFELPKGAPKRYSLKSPWKNDPAKAVINLIAGKKHTFKLKPFEVLVFDATPVE